MQANNNARPRKAERHADHGPSLPKRAKRKAPAGQHEQPLSSPHGFAQPQASPEPYPVQLPKKPYRAPFAAAACVPVPVSKSFDQLEDPLMLYPGEETFQAINMPGQVQPWLTDQMPVQKQLKLPLATSEMPSISAQLPTESVAPAGSSEAGTTAVPKLKQPSISAQPSAEQPLAVSLHAGPSSCATRLEVCGCWMPD